MVPDAFGVSYGHTETDTGAIQFEMVRFLSQLSLCLPLLKR